MGNTRPIVGFPPTKIWLQTQAMMVARRKEKNMKILHELVLDNLTLCGLTLPADNDEFWHDVQKTWIGYCHEHHLRIPWFLTERVC